MSGRIENGEQLRPGRRLAAALGPVGVWSVYLHGLGAGRAAEVLAVVEGIGARAIWTGEGARTKEAMSHSAVLLASSRRLIVATGIANIWARDATAMAAGTQVLAEAYPGRFVLGLGVSHALSLRDRADADRKYSRPLSLMRRYLDQMDATDAAGPAPANPAPRMLAALRPRMLGLAAERTQGAHTFFATVEHTARAREVLGPDPVLAPELAVVLETDRDRARAVAQDHLDHRLDRENYRNHLLELGFTEADLAAGGSDRLFDAVVAWGDVDAVASRVRAHHEAGADHVAVDVLVRNGEDFPVDDLTKLAPAIFADCST